MELFFIITFVLAIYSYTIFPLLLMAWVEICRNPSKKGHTTPLVTIIISAFNEEKDIEDKVRNSLQLDYPENPVAIEKLYYITRICLMQTLYSPNCNIVYITLNQRPFSKLSVPLSDNKSI